jgi:hypothetical protein
MKCTLQRLALLAGLMSCVTAAPVLADPVDDLFASHVAASTYEQGAGELLKASNPKAASAAGTLQFVTAIENLGQSFYKYGLAAPTRRNAMMIPGLRMPVPPNPNPEKIDYQKFRAVLENLVKDLDAAETSLAVLGETDVKLPIDFSKVTFDFDGNGKASGEETLPGIITALSGGAGTAPPSFNVAFDTADIYWLRGYGRFISAFSQFLLAHDFEDLFNKTFHVFFPKAELLTGDLLEANRSKENAGGFAQGEFGDIVAMIHLINWKTIDPARLEDSRKRLVAMAELSPKSWAAARKETDNDREWLPNAKQTQAITGTTNTDEIIDGWLEVMTEFKSVLEGQKLVPHWRFDKGMNVKRLFNESKHFDLVLLIAGTNAAPYLEEGQISDAATWNRLNQTFRGNFIGYAIWFN